MADIEDDGFATVYPALVARLRGHDLVGDPIDSATAAARIEALEAEVARLTHDRNDYRASVVKYRDLYIAKEMRLTAMEANADALARVLRVADSAVEELCQGQDPGNQCWVTLAEIRAALATHTKLKEGK